eukprot:6141088-Prymnesium_polylepis.3
MSIISLTPIGTPSQMDSGAPAAQRASLSAACESTDNGCTSRREQSCGHCCRRCCARRVAGVEIAHAPAGRPRRAPLHRWVGRGCRVRLGGKLGVPFVLHPAGALNGHRLVHDVVRHLERQRTQAPHLIVVEQHSAQQWTSKTI